MNPESGGPCQGIRNSIKAMKSLGVENEVVCLDDANSAFIQEDDFKIYALGPAKSPWGHSKDLRPWLLENLPNYDAVIVHGLWLYPSYAMHKCIKSLKAKNGSSVPKWFVMPHGMLDPYFQKASNRKLKALRNDIYWSIIERKVIENADAVLFTCEQELLLARTTFPNYTPKNELNVGYGIQNPPTFESVKSDDFWRVIDLEPTEKYFLFLSRIHPKKGLDLLIESYSQILRHYSDTEIEVPKLVIAGPGMDSDFGKELLTIVESQKDLDHHVIFPGMLSGKAKWQAFYEAEAFVLPSHQENFGIAVAEALACETPVLISDQINIWREIKSGSAGIIEPDDLEGTYNLFDKWLRLSDSEKQEMKRGAAETFNEKFKINSVIQTMVNAIKESINA